MAPSTSLLPLAPSAAVGNEEEEEGSLDAFDPPLELDPEAADDERPVDVGLLIQPLSPMDDDDDGPESFVELPELPPDIGDLEPDRSDDAALGLPTAVDHDEDSDGGDEQTIWPEFPLPEPPDYDLDDAPAVDLVPLEIDAGELHRCSAFTVDWQDAEGAHQLVAIGAGFASMGRECRHHARSGDIVARCPLPEGFTHAVVFSRTNWMKTPCTEPPADAGLQLMCLARGRLWLRREDEWLPWLDEDRVTIHRVVQHEDDILASSVEGQWYQLEGTTLRPAFGGRALTALCRARSWIGVTPTGNGPRLVALEGESARPLSSCKLRTGARVFAQGHSLLLADGAGGVWVTKDSDEPLCRVAGSSSFRGMCLGNVEDSTVAWTTIELGDGLAVVEIDLGSGRSTVVADLPWRASDEDVPAVHDLLWLGETAQLIVASDYGLVSLKRRPSSL